MRIEIVLVTVFSLAACGKKPAPQAPPASTGSAEPAPTPTEKAAPESAPTDTKSSADPCMGGEKR
ncbi:MAG TPA: hypothetical protein VFQ53_20940 [Kofleriaceae bacterium]|nr:hypothetical protein [Kofleriaceae bacterium]